MTGAGIFVVFMLGVTAFVFFFILVAIPFLVELAQARRCMRHRGSRMIASVEQEPTPAAPKPRVRIRPDGWVRHDGGSFPFAPNVVVETGHAGGFYGLGKQAEYASFWPEEFWRGDARSWRNNILFYRIVRMPVVMMPPGRR